MGKVKAWVMDMEEEFFEYVTEDDLTNAETFQEFVDRVCCKKQDTTFWKFHDHQ